MRLQESVSSLTISDKQIGIDLPCFVIAEVAQTHDGSLGQAHAFIEAVAATGADAIKFQTHIAEAESTPDEPWRIKFSPQDDRRYDYWRRMEFSELQWRGLKEHAEKKGLIFLSSPFSTEAVDMLERVGMPAWKIASGEVSNLLLLERITQTKMPILLSSGMSTYSEIDNAVAFLRLRDVPFAVFQCTSAYPCPPEKVGLNLISELRDRYHCPVGLSDHTGMIFAGLAAAAIGLQMLEVHVTLSREMFGPDVPASLTTAELETVVIGIRNIEQMRANPVNKDALAEELMPLRDIFTKSVVARSDLKAGTILKAEHLTVKKPGGGVPPGAIQTLIGKQLDRDINADQLILNEDLAQ